MSKPKVYWDYDTCYKVAKECSYRSDLKYKYEQAYRTALKNGWINDYTWFVSKGEAITKNKTVYTKDMCYEEAKKYTSKIDFFRNCKGAYVAAKKNRWMLEYTWLIQPKQYKGKFNYGYCYEEAKKYKTRKEFQVGCSCGYHHARINKWLDDYTWFIHPEVSNKKWNKETCYNEAKKYKTLKEFADKSLGAYHVALKNEWIQDYIWLERKKTNIEWNYDNCYNEAKKYKSRSEFKQKNNAAYRCSYNNGWIDKFDWFIKPNKKWGYQTCLEESKKYSTRGEFALGCSGAYHVARENNWLKEYIWLKDGKKLKLEKYGKWTKGACFEEAKKYKSRGEFAEKNGSAYRNARRFGWIDDYTWLKDERLDLIKDKIDCVYAYEFSDFNAVYVGRTLIKRKKDRDREHLYDRNDAVVKFAIKHKIEVPLPIYLEDDLTIKEGVEKECLWVEKYKEMGWNVLNRARGGSIGGLGKGKTRYTYEICFEQARLCCTRTEFRDCGNNAYRVALREGWINDYTWFKDGTTVGASKRRKYDYQTCYEEAKKYKTITEFENGNKGACRAARANGWMKDYTWFTLLWQEKWNKETCYEEAKKYTTLDDFVSTNGSCYATACKNKWIDDYTWLVRKRTRRGYWQNYENCYNEAKKYKTMTDFMRKSSGAYKSAFKKGWIKDYFWLKDRV